MGAEAEPRPPLHRQLWWSLPLRFPDRLYWAALCCVTLCIVIIDLTFNELHTRGSNTEPCQMSALHRLWQGISIIQCSKGPCTIIFVSAVRRQKFAVRWWRCNPRVGAKNGNILITKEHDTHTHQAALAPSPSHKIAFVTKYVRRPVGSLLACS
jgi:hypothetical protein